MPYLTPGPLEAGGFPVDAHVRVQVEPQRLILEVIEGDREGGSGHQRLTRATRKPPVSGAPPQHRPT